MVIIMSKRYLPEERYLPEVREKAVRVVLKRLDEFESSYAAARASAPLVKVHHESLRVWVNKALAEGSSSGDERRAGLSATKRDELQKLRQEVRDLKQTHDILKLTSAFFTRKLDPRDR